MRKQYHVRILKQSWIDVRLFLVDAQPAGQHSAAFEGLNQSVFVDYRAAGCVDYEYVMFHSDEFGVGDDVVCTVQRTTLVSALEDLSADCGTYFEWQVQTQNIGRC